MGYARSAQLRGAVNRLNKSVLDKLGLTYLQYIVLVALYEQDDQTVGGLGDKLFLDSSTLTPLLKRLDTMGHLTRQRDPEDERQVRVRLTAQGRNVREQALAFRGRRIAMSVNGMVRPCSCPASDKLARGAKTRSTPCLRPPIPRSP